MYKDDIHIIIVIILVVSGVFLIGRYIFPSPKYITENEATKKCEEMKGILDISYNYDLDLKKRTSKLIFRCFSPSKELFIY